MYSVGCIVGKFYPPHSGHKHLVETALSKCEKVHLFICNRKTDVPSGSLRENWLKVIYSKAIKNGKLFILLKKTDDYPEEDSVFWAKKTVEWMSGKKPDAVFTSEEYGDSWSRALGCVHELVDLPRVTYPVSGTKVRDNPYEMWNHLDPSVKAFYALRIVLVGAESTGKTTLAQHLQKRYNTKWVHELGREMWEAKYVKDGPNFSFTSQDFVDIAKRQAAIENEFAKECNKLLICDTDAFATTIWHERYLGFESKEVEEIALEQDKGRIPYLYLLSDVTGAPFVQDGTRDGEHLREWMHNRFIKKLESQKKNYVVLSGSYAERTEKAVSIIDSLLK